MPQCTLFPYMTYVVCILPATISLFRSVDLTKIIGFFYLSSVVKPIDCRHLTKGFGGNCSLWKSINAPEVDSTPQFFPRQITMCSSRFKVSLYLKRRFRQTVRTGNRLTHRKLICVRLELFFSSNHKSAVLESVVSRCFLLKCSFDQKSVYTPKVDSCTPRFFSVKSQITKCSSVVSVVSRFFFSFFFLSVVCTSVVYFNLAMPIRSLWLEPTICCKAINQRPFKVIAQ